MRGKLEFEDFWSSFGIIPQGRCIIFSEMSQKTLILMWNSPIYENSKNRSSIYLTKQRINEAIFNILFFFEEQNVLVSNPNKARGVLGSFRRASIH